jgi:hypothetical protein
MPQQPPLVIRRNKTEFGNIWRVKNQGVVIGMFKTGDEALAFIDRELRALERQVAMQQRREEIAAALLANMQNNQGRVIEP